MSIQNETTVDATSLALTATEKRIAGLWSECLETQAPIMPTDSFFALGGDSLGMMMLLFRIKEEFGVDLPPGAVLEAPQLRGFCKQLDLFAGSAGQQTL